MLKYTTILPVRCRALQHMSTVVVALILFRNKYLLIKKAAGRSKGKWAFPNVIVHGAQTHKKALIREIKTTLGLDIWPYKTLDGFADDNINQHVTLFTCSIHSNPSAISLDPHHSAYLWTSILNAATLSLAPIDKDIISFLMHHAALGELTAQKSRRGYDMTLNSTKSRLLTLLQDSLYQNSGTPLSFASLASQLGISRQCLRTHYHQLKTLYPVPPVGTMRRLPVPTDSKH